MILTHQSGYLPNNGLDQAIVVSDVASCEEFGRAQIIRDGHWNEQHNGLYLANSIT
jgi:hypothetical protein